MSDNKIMFVCDSFVDANRETQWTIVFDIHYMVLNWIRNI